MRIIEKISIPTATELIRALKLVPGSSFTNTEPSHLCYEYRSETGYWLEGGNGELVRSVITKNENGEFQYEAWLFLNAEALGIEEE